MTETMKSLSPIVILFYYNLIWNAPVNMNIEERWEKNIREKKKLKSILPRRKHCDSFARSNKTSTNTPQHKQLMLTQLAKF